MCEHVYIQCWLYGNMYSQGYVYGVGQDGAFRGSLLMLVVVRGVLLPLIFS